MAGDLFANLTDVYDAMIDWPKRLANEEPFYRQLFEDFGVRSVVDVACGTGRHAAMFHGWDLRVEGSDISPEMIERARRIHGEAPGLRWVVRGFDASIEPAEPFDAAICVGNSLALAPDEATVERAIRQMLGAVRDDGVIVVHVLNLWRLPDGPCVWQKCLRTTLSGREVLITKGVHRCGWRAYVDLIVSEVADDPEMRTESVPFLGLEAAGLGQMAERAGAEQVAFYGGWHRPPYQRETSVDLIVVAKTGAKANRQN
jgi:SAM-dependent methyltransferase